MRYKVVLVSVMVAAGSLAWIGQAPSLVASRHAHAGGAAPAAGISVGRGAETALITRNSYGVPTVTAKAMPGVWFGAGYAQAQDRLVQLELTRRSVEGTLAQLFGPGEVAQDEGIRNFFYTPQELSIEYQAMPPAVQAELQQYADGVNAFMAKAYANATNEQAMVPYEFFVAGQLLGLPGPYRPGRWRAIDTLAIGNFLARDFGGGGGSELTNLAFVQYLEAELAKDHDANATADAAAVFNDSRWIDDPSSPTTVPSTWSAKSAPAAASTAAAGSSRLVARQADLDVERSLARLSAATNSDVRRAQVALATDRRLILATGIALKVPSHGGSNAFVVAPWRSKDGDALLWGAPQEGFGTPSIDYEEYLVGPGYDAGGMAITGEPFVLIGRNADVAWTTTSEELVDQRIYLMKVRFPGGGTPQYYFDGSWVNMSVLHEKIAVAGEAPQPYTVLRTIDGPIFSLDRTTGIAFAMRFASWKKESGSLVGFSQLGADDNLWQFAHSMSLVTTLHNFLYADKYGNIAYFGDGLVPIEPSSASVDPRLPALGDGSEQWLGFVPFAEMPHSINPAQGYLDNWNTKPSQAQYYQQNGGDEYWGTIFRSSRISQLLAASTQIDVSYLEGIEHDIGQIDNGDNTRPASSYFIPFLEQAYASLRSQHSALTDPATHPDLAHAMAVLEKWNDDTTLGSPAMSIFMNTLEALERNVFEGGTFAGEQYTGAVDFSDASLGMGTYGGLGGFATYNFLYHILAGTKNLVPCYQLCYSGSYFGGNTDEILVESVNDAITILSGTGTQLGQNVPGFGTTDIAKWGYQPAIDTNWNNLDPLAVGVTTSCSLSASQNRSTFMQAIDVGRTSVTGADVLPPGESGFINSAGQPSPHLCDQVGLFNSFRYKPMPAA
jgi:penicillin amidase